MTGWVDAMLKISRSIWRNKKQNDGEALLKQVKLVNNPGQGRTSPEVPSPQIYWRINQEGVVGDCECSGNRINGKIKSVVSTKCYPGRAE